jgi:hypothetical protein
MSTFKELRNIMSKFFDDISAAIKNIHHSHGVDDETVSQKIAEAIDENVKPLQTQLTDQQTQIAELQKALQDTVTALTAGDTEAALATATAAANGSAPAGEPAPGSESAGEGSGEAGTGQATS